MPSQPFPQLTCRRCGETKSALYFHKLSGVYYTGYKIHDPRRYDVQCKRCRKPRKPGQSWEDVPEVKLRSRAASGRGNRKPKPKRKPRSAAERKKDLRTRTRIKSMEYLAARGCEECGEKDPRCLEYDHKNPDGKTHTISRLIINGYGWSSPTMRRELRKCRILCANCHRKHTIEQQGYYADDEIQRTLGVLAARHGFDL